MKHLKLLLIFLPLTFIAKAFRLDEGFIFISVCLSIVPLAVIIGDATEQISLYTGPKIGGLLNATMSNIPELLIGIFAVKAGFYSLVLASLAGSIMGNILLVLGFSIFLGGLRHKFQTFNKTIARSNFSLLAFAAISIIVPFTYKYTARFEKHPSDAITTLSLGIAIILLIIYILGLVFSLITHRSVFVQHQDHEEEEPESPRWGLAHSVFVLAAATILIAIQSETLVSTVGHVIRQFRLSEVFIGIILIPILGNVAENSSAMIMAIKNKVDISVEIAVGSSMQISLFVAPLLIILSFCLGKPMEYVFSPFQVVAMMLSICLSAYVFQDGKTNWLEGVQLVSCYAILGLAFFVM
ncbi:MAG: calcium/proton exchanger [Clostridia bacterium]|nr:calcium/proton exchanger [Clostridia bacterium]